MVLSFPVNICVATKAETPNATAHMMPKHRATPMAFVQPPAAIVGARVLFAGALKKRLNPRKLHPISSQKNSIQYLVFTRVGEILNI